MEAKNGRIHPNSVSNRVKVTLNHNWILLKLKYFWNIWILNLISLKWKMIWICAVGFSRGEFQVLQMKTCSRVTFCCSAVEGFQLLFFFRSRITWLTRRYVMGQMTDQTNELHVVSQMLKLELFILNLYFILILKWATDQVIYFTT